MSSRKQAQQLAKLQDRDRSGIENEGIAVLKRLGFKFRVELLKAIRRGDDPKLAAAELFEQMQPVIATAMMAAHLSGRLRSVRSASSVKGKAVSLATGDPYADALSFLQRRLDAPDDVLQSLRAKYTAESNKVLRLMSDEVGRSIDSVTREVIRQNLPVRSAVQEMRSALDRIGVSNTSTHLLETTVRTQTQIAYSAGRMNANEDPAIQEILWGYEYAAVGDSRTTDICLSLDGMRLPKSNPAWQRLTPPNHYNCRSSLIEIFNDDTLANPTPVPSVQPMPGFDFNPGAVFSDLIAA